MLERKKHSYPLAIKSVDTAGRFAGYASVFNVIDNQRDSILPGAFKKSLQDRANEIRLLWQHLSAEPIGVFERIFEDAKGLYVEGRLLLDVQRAREAYALLKSNAIRGLSIGYTPLRYTIDHETGARLISEVRLWEVSLVTFPANEAANITVVKSASGIQHLGVRGEDKPIPPDQLIALSDALSRAITILS